MKRYKSLLFLCLLLVVAFLLAISARCGFPIGSGTYITVSTNSAIGATNYATVTLPSIYESVTGVTNQYTAFTNNVVHTFTLNGQQYTVIVSAVITNTGVGGTGGVNYWTNWATNWPPQTITVPVYTLFNVQPQINSNTFSVQTY